jgi:hypothetical protein
MLTTVKAAFGDNALYGLDGSPIAASPGVGASPSPRKAPTAASNTIIQEPAVSTTLAGRLSAVDAAPTPNGFPTSPFRAGKPE